MAEGSADPGLPGTNGNSQVAAVTPSEASAAVRISLVVLASLAVAYTVAFTRGFLLPIVLAFCLSIILRPVVQSLVRIGVPRPVGSLLILAGLAGTIVGGFVTLVEPVSNWLQRLPYLIWKLEQRLASVKSSIKEAQEFSEQVSQIAGAGDGSERVVVEGPGLAEQALLHLQDVSITIAATAVLLVFLLAQGRERMQRMIAALPDRNQRYQWGEAIGQARADIALYVRTITLINLALGAMTTGIMALVGLPDPILWGVLAAVANFLPYIGPLTVLCLIAGASLLTFDQWFLVALPPALFFALTTIEGQIATPMILGKRLVINPIAVFIAVLFWSWIWGLPGALLAVPMLTIFKIFCDNVEGLRHFRPLLK